MSADDDDDRCDFVWQGQRCLLRKDHLEVHQFDVVDADDPCPEQSLNPNTGALQRCRRAKNHLGPHQFG